MSNYLSKVHTKLITVCYNYYGDGMKINNKMISIIYKAVLCIIGMFSLIATTGVLDGNLNLNIFSMFTTLSNLLCVIYFILDIIYLIRNYNKKTLVEWFPLLKGITTMAITLTLIVAHFILKMSFSFDSFSNISFLGLHYIVPIMTILDWILFDKKGFIKVYSPIIWTIAPAAYMIVAFNSAILGSGIGVSADSKYPYYFMDIDKLGMFRVALNTLFTTVIYLGIGYIYYFIDRLMIRKRKKRTN